MKYGSIVILVCILSLIGINSYCQINPDKIKPLLADSVIRNYKNLNLRGTERPIENQYSLESNQTSFYKEYAHAICFKLAFGLFSITNISTTDGYEKIYGSVLIGLKYFHKIKKSYWYLIPSLNYHFYESKFNEDNLSLSKIYCYTVGASIAKKTLIQKDNSVSITPSVGIEFGKSKGRISRPDPYDPLYGTYLENTGTIYNAEKERELYYGKIMMLNLDLAIVFDNIFTVSFNYHLLKMNNRLKKQFSDEFSNYTKLNGNLFSIGFSFLLPFNLFEK